MDAAIVLQARMGSHRLPGKVMAEINGRPLVAHCIERLRLSGLPVILATTTLAEDDVLEAEAYRLGAEVVRGADDDVLGRFVQAVNAFSLTDVIRATADNPAVDIDAVQRAWTLLRRTHVDHVVEHRLPVGGAVEAVSAAAILRADAIASDGYDREHVTPLIRRDGRFFALDALAPAHLRHPHLRFTVDTSDDLAFMRRLIAAAESRGEAPAPLATLIEVASRRDWEIGDVVRTARSDAR